MAEPERKNDSTTQERAGGSMTARAFALMFAKTLAFVLGFALPLLLVRRLSVRDFGLYKQVFLIVSTALSVLPLGFSMSAYYFLPRETDERKSAVIFNILFFNVSIGALVLLVMLVHPALPASIFGSPELVSYAPLVGLVILLWMTSLFLEIVTIANQEAKLATFFIVFAQFSKTALLVAAAAGFGTIRALLLAAVAQGLVQNAVLFFYLRTRFQGFWRKPDWSMMRVQLSYALPIGFAGLVYGVLLDLHSYFVSHRFGPEAFAVYSIGCFSLPLIGIIGESFTSLVIPQVSYLQKQGSTREIILLTAQTTRKLSVFFFPLYAFMLVVGREMITVLFTARYLESWPVFAINLTMLPFYALTADPIMRAYAEHRFFLLKVRAVILVLLFAALWFVTQRAGLVGAITTMVCFSIADRLIETFKAWSIVGAKWRDAGLLKDLLKVGAASLVAGVAASLVRSSLVGGYTPPVWILITCAVVFGVVYLSAILLFRVVSPEEREGVRRHLAALQRRSPRRRAADSSV